MVDPGMTPRCLSHGDTPLTCLKIPVRFCDDKSTPMKKKTAIALNVTAAPAQADLCDYQGWFLCNDHLLNKVWYAGAYTVQLDTGSAQTAKASPFSAPFATIGEPDHADAAVPNADLSKEVIYGGGKRDRNVWQGDLGVQSRVVFLSTNDRASVDNSLSALAAQQLPDGYMPAEGLVGQHNRDELRTYGEYVTWFIYNMAEHYRYTGDKAYLQQWWTALQRATAWLESVRALDSQGLIAFESVGSCGHFGYSDCGHETYVNALYVRNLRQMAELATELADVVEQAINAQLWDETVGAYRLSREIPDAYPQDANATAVLAGVADAPRVP
jgi:alpha-L-rhamnosidase-like protein